MSRWIFIMLVALTFAGEVAWSAWMVAPVEELPTAWRETPGRTSAANAERTPSLDWGRHDATLDAILTSAVWKEHATRPTTDKETPSL